MDETCTMHRHYQGANRECNVCGRRLLGEFSGRDINWGNVLYRIREFLGGGGMGEVYRAIEQDNAETFRRECAVKFNKNMMDPEIVERFKREVKILNMLQNPHNIRVYNYGELYEERAAGMEVRAQFMVMELLTGHDLNQVVKKGKLPPREALPIFVQVCSALSEAHQKSIIHRDLKPHNIMLQSVAGDQFAKVFDFGLSRIDSMNDNLSTTGVVMGTFRYMSPEQALNEDMDHRTDIFSLGVVLYEILTGVHPFPAKNLFELFTLHQHGPPPMEGIPDDLTAIVNKALAYEKDKRYLSIDVLRGDLLLWLGDSISGRSINTSQILALQELQELQELEASEALSAPVESPSPASAPPSSRQGLWIGIIAMLVLAVGVGGFFAFQGPDNDANPTLHPKMRRQHPTLVRRIVPQQRRTRAPSIRYIPPRMVTPRRKVKQRNPRVRRRIVRRRIVRRRMTRRYRRRRRRRRQFRRSYVRRYVRPRPRPVVRRIVIPRPPPRRVVRRKAPVRVAMLVRPRPRRIIQRPPPRRSCPSRSPLIRYGQLDRALGRKLTTRTSRYINRAAKETIYDAGLRLSQSWKRSPVICKRRSLQRRILRIIQAYCRRYKPSPSCRNYRASKLPQGGRVVFVCRK